MLNTFKQFNFSLQGKDPNIVLSQKKITASCAVKSNLINHIDVDNVANTHDLVHLFWVCINFS